VLEECDVYEQNQKLSMKISITSDTSIQPIRCIHLSWSPNLLSWSKYGNNYLAICNCIYI